MPSKILSSIRSQTLLTPYQSHMVSQSPDSNNLSMHFSLNLSFLVSAAGGGFHPPDSNVTDDVPEI